MHNNKKEFLASSINLYEYLKVYGDDPHHTKEDLLVLALIRDIVEQNCYFNFLTECTFTNIGHIIMEILHGNPKLKYCRFKLDDYKNLGGKQNIDSYRRLSDELYLESLKPIPPPIVITYYSAIQSDIFTKNDCGPGYFGSAETISTTYGQFTSTISQTDADNKAIT